MTKFKVARQPPSEMWLPYKQFLATLPGDASKHFFCFSYSIRKMRLRLSVTSLRSNF